MRTPKTIVQCVIIYDAEKIHWISSEKAANDLGSKNLRRSTHIETDSFLYWVRIDMEKVFSVSSLTPALIHVARLFFTFVRSVVLS